MLSFVFPPKQQTFVHVTLRSRMYMYRLNLCPVNVALVKSGLMVKPILVFTWRVNAKGFYPNMYSIALRDSFASVITLGFLMFKLVLLLQWYHYYQWKHIFVAFRFLAKPLVQMSTNKNCISNLNEYSFRIHASSFLQAFSHQLFF